MSVSFSVDKFKVNSAFDIKLVTNLFFALTLYHCILLYVGPKWSKTRSRVHKLFRQFLNFFSPIPSNIVAPPSDIVEISADGWKTRLFL